MPWAAALVALVGCKPPANAPPPRSTLVVGLDISGSFRDTPFFKEATDFAGLYIYAHVHGLGGLKQATDVFVGSLGGERVGGPKSFHPIPALTRKAPDPIAPDLPARDP